MHFMVSFSKVKGIKELILISPKGKPKAMRADAAWPGVNLWSNVSDDCTACPVGQPGTPPTIYRNQVGRTELNLQRGTVYSVY